MQITDIETWDRGYHFTFLEAANELYFSKKKQKTFKHFKWDCTLWDWIHLVICLKGQGMASEMGVRENTAFVIVNIQATNNWRDALSFSPWNWREG